MSPKLKKKPNKPKYPTPVVNFDKTSWSIKSESSFNSISRICKILFTEIKDCEPDTRQDFHTNSIQLTSSSSPTSSVFIYYHPLDNTKHPLVRVFAGTITNETLSIFNEIKNMWYIHHSWSFVNFSIKCLQFSFFIETIDPSKLS